MPTISKFKPAAAQWIQHRVSRKILWICALEVLALKYSLCVNFHNKNHWFIKLKQLIHSGMSLDCFWRSSILCASTSLWIWEKKSDTSTAASDPHWAEHKPVSSARISRTGTPRVKVKPWALYAVITWSVGFMAASIPTQQASCYTGQRSLTMKKNTQLPQSALWHTADPTHIKYWQVIGRAEIQETDLNPKDW